MVLGFEDRKVGKENPGVGMVLGLKDRRVGKEDLGVGVVGAPIGRCFRLRCLLR